MTFKTTTTTYHLTLARKSYLDLSTGHLTPATRVLLSSLDCRSRTCSGWPAMTVAEYEYGYVITTPDDSDEDIAEQMKNLPEDLADCLRYAAAYECELIRFDADGHTVKGLPLYEG